VNHMVWLETLFQDVRFALRTFRRRPAFSLSAIAVLAFGVGSSTAIFSVVNGVLLTPLPYSKPASLVRVFGVWEHGSREGVSPPDFEDYRRQTGTFESVAAASNSTPLVNLKGAGEPEQIRTRNVTAGFFGTLGIKPLAGREFLPEDEAWNGPKVTILSYGLWQRQFGGDPAVVGGRLAVNGVPYAVVGVLPSFFNFLGPTDLFTPVQSNPVPEMRGIRTLIMIGRLKPGFDVARGQSELDVLSGGLQQDHPKFDQGWSVRAAPLTDEVVQDVRPALLMLLAAVALFISLVSVNVASLMLSHAASRQGEISIRASLGASRLRVGRQLITESLTLALVAAAAGAALATWGVHLIKGLGPSTIPRLSEVSVDVRALAFALAVSIGMGILFGLEPALRAGRPDIVQALSGGRRAVTRQGMLRGGLVISTVAISVVLLIAAGLMIRSLLRLQDVDPGFQTASVLTTRLALPGSKYGGDGTGAKLASFWRDAIQRMEDIPGVSAAAVTSELPLSGLNNPSPRVATTPDARSHLLYLRSVSPGYCDLMNIPLMMGRRFNDSDRKNSPRVVLINEEFQKDAFGDQNSVGQTLTFNFQERLEKQDYQAVIVGVVGSVRHTSLASAPFREAYLPFEQSPLFSYDVVVRTTVEPLSVARSLREAIWSIDPDESIGPIRTVGAVVDLGLTQPRFRSFVLGLFALAALILAAIGLYGLLNCAVSQRRREIGIRIAVGASRESIMRLILGRGLLLTAAGLGVGLAASIGLARLMSGLVFGIGLIDPIAFIGGSGIQLLVALIASYIPARRATRLDPVAALRSE
jgi:putative ABC transport system permease protein